ncbi:hypothetical protein M407DRAFT_133765 [Tulasnella calospora MUT 4182]|uniref:Uncharacterized protein n=1 Tax=Tulasnella calospora MUT 4182 TaxID=1051891 RepID=A0A0C3QTG2_9AGAM|nr:hypothetical protein M407DRAFT_133765 [Tulasnella calospora MUT 4182]
MNRPWTEFSEPESGQVCWVLESPPAPRPLLHDGLMLISHCRKVLGRVTFPVSKKWEARLGSPWYWTKV